MSVMDQVGRRVRFGVPGWLAPVLVALLTAASSGSIVAQDVGGEGERVFLQREVSVIPKMIKVVKPRYPNYFKNREIEGTVVLQAVVAEDGKVEPASVKVVKSDLHPDLDRACVEALIASEFSPALYGDRPVRVIMQIPYTIRMYGDKKAGPNANRASLLSNTFGLNASEWVIVRAEARFNPLDAGAVVVPQDDELLQLMQEINQLPPHPAVVGVVLLRRRGETESGGGLVDAFSPRDTLRAAVRTVSAHRGTEILARWVYLKGDSKIAIAETTHRSEGEGTDVSHFHVAKPTPWPEGSYELQVGVDGKVQGTARFEVAP